MMCDIDCFKQYNDTYGHLAGDTALKQVAKAIEGSCHRATDLVARYGGEEFVVLLPDTPVQDAYNMSAKMIAAIEKLAIPHKTTKADLNRVSMSIGVASASGETDFGKSELIELADEALYAAKQGGRNCAVLANSNERKAS